MAGNALAAPSLTALRTLESRGGRITALVRDLDTGKNVASLNAEKRLSPASVSKLYVAAAALDVWPVNKSFDTQVLATAPVYAGKVSGHLVIESEGDSTFSHKDLLGLAHQVYAAGVTEVTGGVVAAPRYGPIPCGNEDRCEALTLSAKSYDAPVSALGLDYGSWCIEVTPAAKRGSAAQIRACGGITVPVTITGEITTKPPGRKGGFWITRQTTLAGHDELRVGGNIDPKSRVRRVYRSMSDPALGTAKLFTQMLLELGILVHGRARVEYGPALEGGVLLAEYAGQELSQQITGMMRYSNNFVADLLTLNIAARRSPKLPTQVAEASRFLLKAGPRDRHRPERKLSSADHPVLLSGSGLSPDSRVSASDLVALLDNRFNDPGTFPAFYGTMVVPMDAGSGFLRRGDSDWKRRLAVKTGTLTEPYAVRSVAGYIRKKNGGWMAFAAIVNAKSRTSRVNNSKAMEAIRKDIAAILKAY